MPKFGDANNLWRWEPWVRGYLLQQELMGCCMGYTKIAAQGQGQPGLALNIAGRPVFAMNRPMQATFDSQIAQVLSYAALRDDRTPEILTQIDGQWGYWQTVLPVRMAAIPKTQELMSALIQFCVFVEMRFKHEFACRRPNELNPQIQPMVSTPGHGTFPMGHAVQIYAVGVLLKQLLADAAGAARVLSTCEQIDRLCYRVSENRIVAGVHFPVDLHGGAALGQMLGQIALARFKGSAIPVLAQGVLGFDAPPAHPVPAAIQTELPSTPLACPASDLLAWAYSQALGEWTQLLGGGTAKVV